MIGAHIPFCIFSYSCSGTFFVSGLFDAA